MDLILYQVDPDTHVATFILNRPGFYFLFHFDDKKCGVSSKAQMNIRIITTLCKNEIQFSNYF